MKIATFKVSTFFKKLAVPGADNSQLKQVYFDYVNLVIEENHPVNNWKQIINVSVVHEEFVSKTRYRSFSKKLSYLHHTIQKHYF